MWKCPKCNEEIEDDNLKDCYKCGTAKSEPPIPNDEKLLFILREIASQLNEHKKLLNLQIQTMRAIRWAIIGFAIWFIIQAWIVPSLLSNSH